MSDTQLYLSIGLPMLFNAAMFTVLILYINAKIDSLRNEMNARFETQTQGLLRVEGVLDARLKHLEER
jgi:hypothetical protein